MLDVTQIFDGTFSGTPPTPAGVAITATRDSTNVLNWLVARDMGAGNILGLHVQIMANFATLTSLDIDYQVSADNSTYFSILKKATIPVAQLVVGASAFVYALPINQIFNAVAGVNKAPSFYSKFVYTVNGSNATTGSVFSYVNPALDRNVQYIYPENYTTA